MKRIGRQSIRTRVVIACINTTVCVLIALSSMSIYGQYTQSISRLDTKGQLLTAQASKALSEPINETDWESARVILQVLLDDVDVVKTAFVPANGNGGLVFIETSSTISGGLKLHSVPVFSHGEGRSETLGVLDVTLSDASVWREITSHMREQALNILTFMGVALPLLFFVLRRFFTPIQRFSNAVHAMHQGELDKALPDIDRWDEFGELAKALDGLRAREIELAEMQQANSQKAIREGARIQHALHSTRDIVILIDESDRVIFRNAPAKTFFPEFEVGDTLSEHKGRMQLSAEPVREALSNRSEMDTDVSIRRYGATYYFQARTGPIVDRNGNDLGGLFVASDITKQFELSREALYFASHDPLTGLLNRRQMEMTVSDWAKSPNQTCGMALVDLDYFKEINDTMGHLIGDAVLNTLAQKLREHSSLDDLVVRLGGDEFAIVTRGENSAQRLEAMANSLLAELQKPTLIEGNSIQISISLGIAMSGPLDGAWGLADLMSHADLALYEVKNTGRGHYKIYAALGEVPQVAVQGFR